MIYKTTDKIHYVIKKDEKEYHIWVSPLSVQQKNLLTGMSQNFMKSGDLLEGSLVTQEGVRLGLKRIKGDSFMFFNEDGDLVPYQLEIEDNKLTDDSLSTILNHSVAQEITLIVSTLLSSPQEKFLNEDGSVREDIVFVGVNDQKKF